MFNVVHISKEEKTRMSLRRGLLSRTRRAKHKRIFSMYDVCSSCIAYSRQAHLHLYVFTSFSFLSSVCVSLFGWPATNHAYIFTRFMCRQQRQRRRRRAVEVTGHARAYGFTP